MMRRSSSRLQVVVLAVGIAGCAPAITPVGDDRPPVEPASQQAEVPMVPTLESISDAVLADAATRTGVDRASLVLESAAAVTWADGSLGCPQPGMSYTMALVPGYRIIVRAGAQALDYHASQRGYFVLCPAGRAAEPVPDQSI